MPLLYTVYVTSGSGDLWFEVFFHPLVSSISTPFAKVESRSIAEPIFRANPADLEAGAQFASCLIHWSAVNQQCSSTHDVLGGVMQAPSAVESEMSCWPVYIYVFCLNWMFPKIVVYTPKSSILIGSSIINHPFWGTPIFGNTQLLYLEVWFNSTAEGNAMHCC